MTKLTNSEKGFTLIELILYVALVGIFITSVVMFAWDIIHSGNKSRTEQQVIYATRAIAKRVAFEVRNASAINSVSASSISLANSDSARNPTVIDLSGGRVRIGWGASGGCPTTSPCFLSSNEVTVQSLIFTDYSNAGNTTDNVRFEVAVKSNAAGVGKDWFYVDYATGSAEVRSK